jgi:hypothetical protein
MLLTRRYPPAPPPLALANCEHCPATQAVRHEAGCPEIPSTIYELVMGVPMGWDYPRRLPEHIRVLLLAVEAVEVWQTDSGISLAINTATSDTHDVTRDIKAAERMGLIELAEGKLFGAQIWYLTRLGEKALRRFRWLPWRTR